MTSRANNTRSLTGGCSSSCASAASMVGGRAGHRSIAQGIAPTFQTPASDPWVRSCFVLCSPLVARSSMAIIVPSPDTLMSLSIRTNTGESNLGVLATNLKKPDTPDAPSGRWSSSVLTRALLGLWIFHDLLGGGGGSGASFSIGLVGPKPYQCLFEPYQCSSEPYQCLYSHLWLE